MRLTTRLERKRVLAEARRFVDRHLGDRDLGREQVARHLHVSVSQLQRAYMEANTSFTADLLDRRMARASELLERGEPARQVATNVGYGSGSALAKAFRRRYGVRLHEVKPPVEDRESPERNRR